MGSITKKDQTANTALDRARRIAIHPPPDPVITGPFAITINESATGNAYVGYSPCACSIRVTNTPAADVQVTLQNRNTAAGGQVQFRTTYAGAAQDTLSLTLPAGGAAVTFFIGGKPGFASTQDQDGGIAVLANGTSTRLHEKTLMVRVRKNANTLTAEERDRFLYAFSDLNRRSGGNLYEPFLDSHDLAADPEIHRRPAFLPWHRAFILDLERSLQEIDPSVALPYWKFDEPAPNVFTPDFMGGEPINAGRVTINETNPLRVWSARGSTGIARRPLFTTATSGGIVMAEADVMTLGATFTDFRIMENDPHGAAHVSFEGTITDPGTASGDPLFFMLHCNVDRLWAKWQMLRNLFTATDVNAYAPTPTTRPIGDAPGDTMWPWNGVTGSPRPSSAPGGAMPQLAFTSKPSPQVTVGETIDYLGKTQGNSNFFNYDDLPFV
ncbi:tyrosinase [Filimonas zeae]|uniref:Tyrosinase copper-binding domain-containing protein n=1 Tax=Filimonas zeae TaxID=1737353 RepID=A0A917MWY3_9BACT|nr:tyrosinase family protein [Filimonas zeae]MDR6340393.1 tyrosinase [Filimonas zeae]GGH72533.1 hypothetical protein GCM10011379_33060 [Filimonas zeae]